MIYHTFRDWVKGLRSCHLDKLYITDLVHFVLLDEGYTLEQTARILGVTPAAVTSRRKKLRQLFPGLILKDTGERRRLFLSGKGREVASEVEYILDKLHDCFSEIVKESESEEK